MKYFILLFMLTSSFATSISKGIDIRKIGNAITLIKEKDNKTYLDFFDKVKRIKLSENGWSYSAIYKDSAIIYLTPDAMNYESYTLLAVMMHELKHIQMKRSNFVIPNEEYEEVLCNQFASDILKLVNGPRSLIEWFDKSDGKHIKEFRRYIMAHSTTG